MKQEQLSAQAYFWALQGLCALHRKPFSIELAQQQCAAPYTNEALLATLKHYGLDTATRKCKGKVLHKEAFPLIVWLKADSVNTTAQNTTDRPNDGSVDAKDRIANQSDIATIADVAFKETPDAAPTQRINICPALVLQADQQHVLLVEHSDASPRTISLAEFEQRFTQQITRVTPTPESGTDADMAQQAQQSRRFGFS